MKGGVVDAGGFIEAVEGYLGGLFDLLALQPTFFNRV